jgi:GDP-L-fucose synthase
MKFNLKNKSVWVTGPNGMVGKSVIKELHGKCDKIFEVSKKKLDLKDQVKVNNWIRKNKPDAIIMTAAKVGGIYANNKFPAEFIYDNLSIQNNIIEGARINKVKKLIFIGSSCIYPKNCKQPIKEEYLLTGALEKTNEWYAVAKIAGIKMIQAYRRQYNCKYISLMPCNMYGPNDNYHSKNSHVLAALIKKFVEAKKLNKKIVEIWGTGKPLREFMHVEDFAKAIIFCMSKYNKSEPINIGSGEEITINDLAKKISKLVKFKGKIIFNKNYPDGTYRKILNSKKIKKIGWRPIISLDNGISEVIKSYSKNK